MPMDEKGKRGIRERATIIDLERLQSGGAFRQPTMPAERPQTRMPEPVKMPTNHPRRRPGRKQPLY